MAWTEPRTYAAGQRLLADDLNAISDNLREMGVAVASTVNSLLYSDGRNSITELRPVASGAANSGLWVVRSGGAAPVWSRILRSSEMFSDVPAGLNPPAGSGPRDDGLPPPDGLSRFLIRRGTGVFYYNINGGAGVSIPVSGLYVYVVRDAIISDNSGTLDSDAFTALRSGMRRADPARGPIRITPRGRDTFAAIIPLEN